MVAQTVEPALIERVPVLPRGGSPVNALIGLGINSSTVTAVPAADQTTKAPGATAPGARAQDQKLQRAPNVTCRGVTMLTGPSKGTSQGQSGVSGVAIPTVEPSRRVTTRSTVPLLKTLAMSA